MLLIFRHIARFFPSRSQSWLRGRAPYRDPSGGSSSPPPSSIHQPPLDLIRSTPTASSSPTQDPIKMLASSHLPPSTTTHDPRALPTLIAHPPIYLPLLLPQFPISIISASSSQATAPARDGVVHRIASHHMVLARPFPANRGLSLRPGANLHTGATSTHHTAERHAPCATGRAGLVVVPGVAMGSRCCVGTRRGWRRWVVGCLWPWMR